MVSIAVDFDDTLVKIDADGVPYAIEGAEQALSLLKNHGYRIIINTCRVTLAKESNELEEEIEFIDATLRSLNIPYDEIHLGSKLIADLYIDDRSIQFCGDWVKTLAEVDRKLADID